DYLNWLAQSRPLSVFGQRGSFFYEDYRAAGMDDLGQCVVRYESGVIGTLIAGRPRSAHAAPWITADLTGEQGSLRATGNMPLLEVAGERHRLQSYGSPGLKELCADFVDCVLNDTPSPIPAEAGLASLEIVQAAYESARTGRAVLPNE
ncbi:MAG: Gfo/Idh/MocA family oxidoreductase, partial [Armatimonadota bacterium]